MKYPNKIDEYRRPLKIFGVILLSVALVLLIVGAVKFLDRKKADNRDDVYAPYVYNGVVTDWGNVIDVKIRNRYIGGKVKTTKIAITTREANVYTETVRIPASVTEITKESFDFFWKLKSIKVSIFNKHYKSVDGVLYSKDGKTLIRYPIDKDGESFTVPDGVEIIAYNAFYGNANLKSINIPSSVTTIDEGAFKRCALLRDITIPDSVVSIGDYAFSKCEGLKNITLGNNLESVGEGAFSHCISLESIVLPDSLKNFGAELFLGCWELSDVALPNGIEEIPDGMLSCCDSLTSFIVPNTVKRIGKAAFDGAGLVKIVLPEGLETIEWRAFEDCKSLKEIIFPESIKLIDGTAFQNCSSLEKITFSSGNIRMGGGIFFGCTRLKSVYAPSLEDWLLITFENHGSNPLEFGAKLYFDGNFVTDIEIPEGTKVIGAYQFLGYSYLESVKLPEGLEKIFNSAFENCKKIKKITLPSSLKLIDNAAFSKCTSLESIYVSSLDFCLALKGYGSVFSNARNLYINGERITDVIVPDGVERINDFAFCNWRFLESIYIPASVEHIGYYGLANCESLTSIRYGGTVDEWKKVIEQSTYWRGNSDGYTVVCVDGKIEY